MYFLIVLQAGQSEIKVPADLVPGENSLSGLQVVTFSVCPHMAKAERTSELSGVSS